MNVHVAGAHLSHGVSQPDAARRIHQTLRDARAGDVARVADGGAAPRACVCAGRRAGVCHVYGATEATCKRRGAVSARQDEGTLLLLCSVSHWCSIMFSSLPRVTAGLLPRLPPRVTRAAPLCRARPPRDRHPKVVTRMALSPTLRGDARRSDRCAEQAASARCACTLLQAARRGDRDRIKRAARTRGKAHPPPARGGAHPDAHPRAHRAAPRGRDATVHARHGDPVDVADALEAIAPTRNAPRVPAATEPQADDVPASAVPARSRGEEGGGEAVESACEDAGARCMMTT